jgi:hypothetical protein
MMAAWDAPRPVGDLGEMVCRLAEGDFHFEISARLRDRIEQMFLQSTTKDLWWAPFALEYFARQEERRDREARARSHDLLTPEDVEALAALGNHILKNCS